MGSKQRSKQGVWRDSSAAPPINIGKEVVGGHHGRSSASGRRGAGVEDQRFPHRRGALHRTHQLPTDTGFRCCAAPACPYQGASTFARQKAAPGVLCVLTGADRRTIARKLHGDPDARRSRRPEGAPHSPAGAVAGGVRLRAERWISWLAEGRDQARGPGEMVEIDNEPLPTAVELAGRGEAGRRQGVTNARRQRRITDDVRE